MKQHLLKVHILFISVILVFSLSCCKHEPTEMDYNKSAYNDAKTIFIAIKKHDSETIKKLFCAETNNTHNLDEEIEGIYEYIDGDFVSYKEISASLSGMTTENWKTTRLNGCPRISGIVTSTDQKYEIHFNKVFVYSENEDWVGISQITIAHMQYGSPIDIYKVGEGLM